MGLVGIQYRCGGWSHGLYLVALPTLNLVAEKTNFQTSAEPLERQQTIGGSHFSETLYDSFGKALSSIILPAPFNFYKLKTRFVSYCSVVKVQSLHKENLKYINFILQLMDLSKHIGNNTMLNKIL